MWPVMLSLFIIFLNLVHKRLDFCSAEQIDWQQLTRGGELWRACHWSLVMGAILLMTPHFCHPQLRGGGGPLGSGAAIGGIWVGNSKVFRRLFWVVMRWEIKSLTPFERSDAIDQMENKLSSFPELLGSIEI